MLVVHKSLNAQFRSLLKRLRTHFATAYLAIHGKLLVKSKDTLLYKRIHLVQAHARSLGSILVYHNKSNYRVLAAHYERLHYIG